MPDCGMTDSFFEMVHYIYEVRFKKKTSAIYPCHHLFHRVTRHTCEMSSGWPENDNQEAPYDTERIDSKRQLVGIGVQGAAFQPFSINKRWAGSIK